tara:strand:- start:81 stop:1007 length:927 start_codon:yes stop_codon:yes gene_type:complete
MVFPLKEKNKSDKNKFDHRKLEKIKSMFSKVKCEAQNEIYLNGWSNQNLEKKDNYINCDENINFTFKNYIVKTVKEPDPIVSKSKELRYKSFFGDKKELKIDSDKFDQFCDHLVVIDKSIADDFVVGTYRLLFKPKNIKNMRFYSESEFDLNKLLKIKKLALLEAGRSCVHKNYRDGRIIKLLWRGLASYIAQKKVDLIFGCASFPSSNSVLFNKELSYLSHNHLPPKTFNSKPLSHLKARFNKINSEDYDAESVFRSLPPLIKAYIRAGAWISEGAACDHKFNTTDVLIILKSENIIKKYSNLSMKT